MVTRAASSNPCRATARIGMTDLESVEWVEPTGRANARPMINSAIPITSSRHRANISVPSTKL
jgi:hypothetical protein